LRRWVAPMTPPLPAASRPSNRTCLELLADHPILQSRTALQSRRLFEIGSTIDRVLGPPLFQQGSSRWSSISSSSSSSTLSTSFVDPLAQARGRVGSFALRLVSAPGTVQACFTLNQPVTDVGAHP
jgi:hypothetical protein